MSSIEGLPGNVHGKVDQAINSVRQLQASFLSATSFRDLPSRILVQAHEQITKAREALDMLVEYVALNMPLNWIVGPFQASPAGAAEVTVAEMPTSGGPEGAEAQKDAGETITVSGAQKETVMPSQALRAVSKSTKMPERAQEPEAGQVKEAGKTQEAKATVETLKRAKRESKEREGEAKKTGKSALNETIEVPEKKP